MTLGDFLNYFAENPFYIIYYFIAIPLAAFLANVFGKGEGHLNPWCMMYAILIYLVAIPGIFSIILNLYHILFENHSIYDTNIFAQILPIISMVLTFYLIKQNVSFKQIPGFGKLANLLGMIAGLMVVLFILEKLRIVAFTFIPFTWFVLLLILLFVGIRFGTKRLLRGE
ncbi:MAG: hypothetical protein HKN09_07215 [Saprospiraceae bacterium]|nr:hypothetical protein [Saprospiraceae bacterium]